MSGNIYDFNNSGDMLSGGHISLCASGTVSGFNFDFGAHTWSWMCA